MNVLSLFDGMSCGQIALERAGIKVDNYYASEIDKQAIKVTMANYPNTIQLGNALSLDFRTIAADLIIGGSPCQTFSKAGLKSGFNGVSGLVLEFVEAVKIIKPKWFLLENVNMKKENAAVISQALEVDYKAINSSNFSAQERLRYYWTNIPLSELPRNNETIADITGFNSSVPDGVCIIDSEIRRFTKRDYLLKIDKNGNLRPYQKDAKRSGISEIGTIRNPSQKSVSIIKSHAPKTYKSDPFSIYVLSPDECEDLQTVPRGYTSMVPMKKRYELLGNGWTVDVIAWILNPIDIL